MKRSRSIKRALSTLLLSIAFSLMLACSSWAQSPAMFRIGVLTPGGDFAPALEGLRQRLAQLGYVEGKQVNFIVEDTKMETLDPVKSAMKLLESKPTSSAMPLNLPEKAVRSSFVRSMISETES